VEKLKPNAKTKEIHGRNLQQNGEDDRQRLAEATGRSAGNGAGKQDGFISGDCEKNNSSRNTHLCREELSNEGNSGKILEEVLLLKQQFLDYVKSDQNRLEARLHESRRQEQEFLSHAESIENRLRLALGIEDSTDLEPNEHITENH
jgi:hypothetical protein